jgi:L-alanine-DL-glutamate epimerase-like enolase superfamily enzyme
MKIERVDMLHADAGWRPWSFVKITTDEGLVGWSECTDSHGSPSGMQGVVRDLSPLLIGQDPRKIGKLLFEMHSRTRQSPGSIIQKSIGGIENALWDIKAKALNVPVYELFGGVVRDSIPLYWSHCGTSRVRASDIVQRAKISEFGDIKAFGKEVKASGYNTLKTNIAVLGKNPYIYMPGFYKSGGGPALNADASILEAIEQWIGGLRSAVGSNIGIALDLNFNFKTDGYIKIGRLLEKYNLSWLEIDTYDPVALRQIKDSISIPITSCENLYGARQYQPFFQHHAMDTAAIDVIWNGFSESKRIAEMADLHEMNICPHNYNGHLSTMISMQLCAIVPNLRIAEVDVDDVPWRDELFTRLPKIENGEFKVSSAPGWGTDVNEKVLERYKWPKI